MLQLEVSTHATAIWNSPSRCIFLNEDLQKKYKKNKNSIHVYSKRNHINSQSKTNKVFLNEIKLLLYKKNCFCAFRSELTDECHERIVEIIIINFRIVVDCIHFDCVTTNT